MQYINLKVEGQRNELLEMAQGGQEYLWPDYDCYRKHIVIHGHGVRALFSNTLSIEEIEEALGAKGKYWKYEYFPSGDGCLSVNRAHIVRLASGKEVYFLSSPSTRQRFICIELKPGLEPPKELYASGWHGYYSVEDHR